MKVRPCFQASPQPSKLHLIIFTKTKMHLVSRPKFSKTVFPNFSWVLQSSHLKCWRVNKVHCGLFENGEWQRKVLSALIGNQEDPGDEFARHSSNREKSLRHVTWKQNFWMTTNLKRHCLKLLSIMPRVKPSSYNLRRETCFKPKINTMRFKNYFNLLIV